MQKSKTFRDLAIYFATKGNLNKAWEYYYMNIIGRTIGNLEIKKIQYNTDCVGHFLYLFEEDLKKELEFCINAVENSGDEEEINRLCLATEIINMLLDTTSQFKVFLERNNLIGATF